MAGACAIADDGEELPSVKQSTILTIWGNKETMNIDHLILNNIRSSPYLNEDLSCMTTYHEVVDEIYYKVTHLEPWENNCRKFASHIGHAGEAREESSGGIVSATFCLLYKLFTLKLTRKQLQRMLDHTDSPYIRGIGFMYIRYCQPPSDFLTWFEPYFDDDEMIDLKAGRGFQTTIGEMCKMMLLELDWFGTLFPRIPVNVEARLKSLVPATASREASRSFEEAERRIKEEMEEERECWPTLG